MSRPDPPPTAPAARRAPPIGTDDADRLARELLADNESLYAKVAGSVGCGRERVAAALAEVVRFLHLVAASDQPLTPSVRVDRAWHELILCTRAYARLCTRRFGRFIHHTPGGDPAGNRRQYAATLARYRDAYGPPDEDFWGRAADTPCGPCDAEAAGGHQTEEPSCT